MIFDCVISASHHGLRNNCPVILETVVLNVERELFILAPVNLLDEGVQVVVPALAALLSDATWDFISNRGPLLWPMLNHSHKKGLVFKLAPGPLDQERVEHFLPSVEALDVSATLQLLGNLLPILTFEFLYCLLELLVLALSPMTLVALALLVLGRARPVHLWVFFVVLHNLFFHLLYFVRLRGPYSKNCLRRCLNPALRDRSKPACFVSGLRLFDFKIFVKLVVIIDHQIVAILFFHRVVFICIVVQIFVVSAFFIVALALLIISFFILGDGVGALANVEVLALGLLKCL